MKIKICEKKTSWKKKEDGRTKEIILKTKLEKRKIKEKKKRKGKKQFFLNKNANQLGEIFLQMEKKIS